MIFSFGEKDALLGILVPATMEAGISLTSGGTCICIWGLGGSDVQLLCGVMVEPKVTGGQSAAPVLLNRQVSIDIPIFSQCQTCQIVHLSEIF